LLVIVAGNKARKLAFYMLYVRLHYLLMEESEQEEDISIQ
jgi:hypothetical protein